MSTRVDESPVAGLVADELPGNTRAVLNVLQQARDYGERLKQSEWDFAVALAELCTGGTTEADIRWLVNQGHIAHAVETTPAGHKRRRFRRLASLAFPRGTCFVLTEKGAAVARTFLEHGSQPQWKQSRSNRLSPNENGNGSTIPRWVAERRELWFDGQLVKRFRQPAGNQQAVLAAFEEEGWPSRLDDPLTQIDGKDAKEHLRETIKNLNRYQMVKVLRFSGDGTGEGICWKQAR